jgi:hypothetical protein
MTTISIRTAFIAATDTSGSRIKAAVRNGEFKGKQITVGIDHAVRDPHAHTARALATKLGIVGDVMLTSEHETGQIFTVVAVDDTEMDIRDEPTVPDQVVTRYVGPVNFRNARVGARMLSGPFEGKRVTVDYDHAARDAHAVAVYALLSKVGVTAVATESGAEIGNGFIYNIL